MRTRPLLRYHGGKWMLAPWIISHFPAHKVYVEPFGGAASVLLRKPRTYSEVYNELDEEITSLFRVVRDPMQSLELRRQLAITPFSRLEFKLSYKPSDDPVEQARRTIVRSFMGFGSSAASGHDTGFRANSNRSGTTPAHDWANYPPNLDWITERLQGVVIESRDAIDCMKQHDSPETLHYVDPPYDPSTRSGCKGYRYELSDHTRLLQCVADLSGAVIISGYRTDLYDDFLREWRRIDRAAHADGARKRVESLWLNAKAQPLNIDLFRETSDAS